MLRSVLLYVIDSGILFLLFFSLHVNGSFLSILSTFLICSSRTSSLYCRSRNFCLMIAQSLLNSVLVEQIVFCLKALPYGMLLFRDLGCSDLACNNACWSVGLRYKVVWILLFLSLYNRKKTENYSLSKINIIALLDNTPSQPSKFRTKIWV